MVRMVRAPTAGMSKRWSWLGLHTFTATARPRPRSPPLARVASVPSTASTANTLPAPVTTHWPMSRLPMDWAISHPKSMSFSSSAEGRRFVQQPDGAKSSGKRAVEAWISIPLSAKRSAKARNSPSSWVFFKDFNSLRAVMSGRRRKTPPPF